MPDVEQAADERDVADARQFRDGAQLVLLQQAADHERIAVANGRRSRRFALAECRVAGLVARNARHLRENVRCHESVRIDAGLNLQADADADVLDLLRRTADARQCDGVDDRNLIAGDDLGRRSVERRDARPRDGAALALLDLGVARPPRG